MSIESTTEVELPAHPAEVWHSLTSDSGFAAWMGDDSTIDARPGGELFTPDPATGVERRGRVEEVEVARSLRYRWWPIADPEAPSSVSIELEPISNGTRVIIVERIDQIPAGPSMSAALAWQWRGAMAVVAIRHAVTV